MSPAETPATGAAVVKRDLRSLFDSAVAGDRLARLIGNSFILSVDEVAAFCRCSPSEAELIRGRVVQAMDDAEAAIERALTPDTREPGIPIKLLTDEPMTLADWLNASLGWIASGNTALAVSKIEEVVAELMAREAIVPPTGAGAVARDLRKVMFGDLRPETHEERMLYELRTVDSLDCQWLMDMLPDSGHGKFWKAVASKLRDEIRAHANTVLHRATPPCEPDAPDGGEVDVEKLIAAYAAANVNWASDPRRYIGALNRAHENLRAALRRATPREGGTVPVELGRAVQDVLSERRAGLEMAAEIADAMPGYMQPRDVAKVIRDRLAAERGEG